MLHLLHRTSRCLRAARPMCSAATPSKRPMLDALKLGCAGMALLLPTAGGWALWHNQSSLRAHSVTKYAVARVGAAPRALHAPRRRQLAPLLPVLRLLWRERQELLVFALERQHGARAGAAGLLLEEGAQRELLLVLLRAWENSAINGRRLVLRQASGC